MSRRRNTNRAERRARRAAAEDQADQLMVIARIWSERAALLDAAGHGARARAAERISAERAARSALVRMGVPHPSPLPDGAVRLVTEALADLAMGDAVGADLRRDDLFRLIAGHVRQEVTA